VRAVVLTGEGPAFCAGGDVKGFHEALTRGGAGEMFHGMPTVLHDMILLMKLVPQPVLAAVNGPAVGAGFSLAAAADLLIASTQAYFSLGYLKIGLSPDGGSTFFLPRILGIHKTFELLCSNDRLSPADAKQMGLVAQVVPAEEFAKKTEDYARGLAALPTRAVGEGKRLIVNSLDTPLEVQLNRETLGVKKISQTADFLEGVTAFVEKRKPQFKGK
jgi:Enoyl-CoA hydratase/carnithine racemase